MLSHIARTAAALSILTFLLQSGITKQDYYACKRDVLRFCRNASDLSGAVSCLHGVREMISKPCQDALGRHGM